MGQIYGRAKSVICWVGPAEKGSDTALATLDTSPIDAAGKLTIEQGRAVDDAFLEHSLNPRNCAALEHFSKRPYWRRAWIVQEIALAKKVVVLYGSVELRWESLRSLCLLGVLMHTGPSVIVSPELDQMGKTAGLLSKRDDILSVTANHVSADATDLRDKIFVFYGLAYDSARFVTVDYSKTATEIYEHFAKRYIEQTERLGIILHAWLRGSTEEQALKLPFWVPDWSLGATEGRYSLAARSLYSAAQGTKCQVDFGRMGNILPARGVLCDMITMYKSEVSFFGLEDLLFSRAPNDYPTATPRLQATFRALTGDSYGFSVSRLNDDPNEWRFRLIIGFLMDLGIQANPGAPYARILEEGVPRGEIALTHLPSQIGETDKPTFLAHTFTTAFRDWAERCIRVLEYMISHRLIPTPIENGGMNTTSRTLWRRIKALEAGEELQNMVLSPNIDHLLAWKEKLQRTRTYSSMADMLELILGVPGAANAIPCPEMPTIGHEVYYWPRYHMTRAFMSKASTFITRTGCIGTGPENVRAGDIISVLYGCDLPIVLRPVGHQYVLVGHCYVEGLMDGQAIDLANEGKAVEQEFEII